MFKQIKSTYKKIAFTKYMRIENYIELLDKKYIVTSLNDRERIKEIHKLVRETLKAVKVLTFINTISYFGIYFSMISAVFSSGFILSGITETLGIIVGFFGTTLFVVLLFFTGKLNDLYYQDLNMMSSHIITIYSKHKMVDENLYGGENSYQSFINFFSENLK
ncbi:MAG: hypothetical protein HRU03_04720 [Nanoarchaeales archaeon]|nr:hypothetical protein [Nanoarchaeales archaeon]